LPNELLLIGFAGVLPTDAGVDLSPPRLKGVDLSPPRLKGVDLLPPRVKAGVALAAGCEDPD
jgi:hypothetical protein